MSLNELRAKYPFKPYDVVYIGGGDQAAEVVSYPWLDGVHQARIMVRVVVGDPTTMLDMDPAVLEGPYRHLTRS